MKNKFLKIAGLVLLILISFAYSAPFLFKGRILNHISSRLNKDLNAQVSISDLDISWFRHFPHMAIGLNNVQVNGTGEFSGDTLLSAKQIDLAFSLVNTLFSDSIKIYSVTLDQPRIEALVHKNGHNNWTILKTGSFQNQNSPASEKALKFDLKRYAIHNGYINFSDQFTHKNAEIINMNHEGKGDFSSARFTLKTTTTADALSVNDGDGISWLSNAKTSLKIAFHVDNFSHTYSFNAGKLSLNDLNLRLEGVFQSVSDSAYNIDMKFNSPSLDLKNVLSLLPSVYNSDFANIKTSGQVNFNGFLRGSYDNNHRPAYHANLDIRNGFFQYTDLPRPVQHINVSIHLDNPDGLASHTNLYIPKGHVELGTDSLDFHLLLKNSGTEPFIDAGAKGKVDFAKVSQWTKLKPGTKLKGVLMADAYVRGNGAVLEKHAHEPFKAGGSLDLSNFSYSSLLSPGFLSFDELLLTFHPDNIMLNELKGEYLATHFTADGAFRNPFSFLLQNKPLEGSIHIAADELSLNDWMGISVDTAKSLPLRYSAPLVVPRNVNLVINADAEKVHYNNLDMQHLSGSFQIADETIKLNNIRADALEGAIIINGSYSTKNSLTSPDMSFTYDAKGLDVQKTFFAFNTVQRIMPVCKFISGKLSAQMTMNGKLGENMVPDLNTLSGGGNILLIEGEMKNFGPFDKLAQSLDVAQLEDIAVKNVQTDFTFSGNKVLVNSFKVNVNNIEMEIGGSHGFDQSLDYAINLKVPKKQLGNKGIEWVKNIVTQEANKGIPIQLGDNVSMNVVMSGTINSPIVKTDMNDMIDNAATDLKQQVDDFVKAKLDSAKLGVREPARPLKNKSLTNTVVKNKLKSKSKKGPQLAHNKITHQKGKRKSKATKKYYTMR